MTRSWGARVDELRIVEGNQPGRDRVFAVLPDGVAVAWLDRTTDEVKILREEYGPAALEALAPYRTHPSDDLPKVQRAQRPLLPPLTPDLDLARNRAGELLREKLASEGPNPFERFLSWVLRRDSEWDSWRVGLTGERRVGRELERLSGQGWRALHSIPLPNSVDIDHLLIGPGGVFNINTKNHPGKSVWVGNDSARVNHGPWQPYTRKVRAEARRVQRVLESYTGTAVQVQPVLVFVGVSDLESASALTDVRVWEPRKIATLGPMSGRLSPEEIETLYAIARHRSAWLEA
ncbi:NERD domain-containing protein [Streptomyces luteoverticillatus]|uniref:NERD domain-containing protein n=1 Tax=Streptomyces luteoverticillatus TaxID=66425 RepID=A0A3Q9FX31_STRLT|nr:NERD domain-containing protein [Streptomyces luteoverticillatus]